MNPTPLRSNLPMNGALAASVVAIALGGLVLLVGLGSLAASAFSGAAAEEPKKVIDYLVAQHTEDMTTYQDRFKKRSIFFKPPPRPPKYTPRPPEPPKPEVVYEPPKPIIPERYPGPSVGFAVGDSVYFLPTKAGGKHLKVQVGEEKEGLRVISTDLPWSIKVGYVGGVYDVPVFPESDFSAFFASSRPTTILPGIIVVDAPPVALEAKGEPGPAVAETVSPEEGRAAGRAGRRLPGRNAAKPVQPADADEKQDEESEKEKEEENPKKPVGPPE